MKSVKTSFTGKMRQQKQIARSEKLIQLLHGIGYSIFFV